MAGKCAVVGKDNKKDKTREEADMTLSPVFPKSLKMIQKCPRVVQIHISGVFYRYPSFGSLLDHFLHFWKKRAKGHVSLRPGLVLVVVLTFRRALACHSVVLETSKCHIKLSLEMPEKITFSEIKVQSYVFYF